MKPKVSQFNTHICAHTNTAIYMSDFRNTAGAGFEHDSQCYLLGTHHHLQFDVKVVDHHTLQQPNMRPEHVSNRLRETLFEYVQRSLTKGSFGFSLYWEGQAVKEHHHQFYKYGKSKWTFRCAIYKSSILISELRPTLWIACNLSIGFLTS